MALLEFRCKAAGGFFMMPATFKEVCKVLNRPYAESGSWPEEDVAAILEVLEKEVQKDREQAALEKQTWEEENLRGRGYMTYEQEEAQKKRLERVNFATRVFPMLEMLRAAEKRKVPVMWGVP